MDKKYCDGCPNLVLTEEEQAEVYRKTGECKAHWCTRYDSIVRHNGKHPRLPALSCCNYNRSKNMVDETKDENKTKEKPVLKDLSESKGALFSMKDKREEKKKALKTTKYDFIYEHESYPDKKLNLYLGIEYRRYGIDITYYYLVSAPEGMEDFLNRFSSMPNAQIEGPDIKDGKIRRVCEERCIRLNRFEKFLQFFGLGRTLEEKTIKEILKLQKLIKDGLARQIIIREKEKEFKKKLQ